MADVFDKADCWASARLRISSYVPLSARWCADHELGIVVCDKLVKPPVTISLFFIVARLLDLLFHWTNFAPSFVDALRLNPAFIALRRAWPISVLLLHGRLLLHVQRVTQPTSFLSHGRLLLHAQRVTQPTSFLSHGPLIFYIRLSFSAMDIAWSVRWVPTYIRRHLLYLYL